jgi:hypothetical protein
MRSWKQPIESIADDRWICNTDGRGKTKCLETNHPNPNYTLTTLELNRVLCPENLATKRPSYDNVFLLPYSNFDQIFWEPPVPDPCWDYPLSVPWSPQTAVEFHSGAVFASCPRTSWNHYIYLLAARSSAGLRNSRWDWNKTRLH